MFILCASALLYMPIIQMKDFGNFIPVKPGITRRRIREDFQTEFVFETVNGMTLENLSPSWRVTFDFEDGQAKQIYMNEIYLDKRLAFTEYLSSRKMLDRYIPDSYVMWVKK